MCALLYVCSHINFQMLAKDKSVYSSVLALVSLRLSHGKRELKLNVGVRLSILKLLCGTFTTSNSDQSALQSREDELKTMPQKQLKISKY